MDATTAAAAAAAAANNNAAAAVAAVAAAAASAAIARGVEMPSVKVSPRNHSIARNVHCAVVVLVRVAVATRPPGHSSATGTF